MRVIRWIQNTYSTLAGTKTLTQIMRESVEKFKSNVHTYLFKAQHLKETNQELAFYHYERGNVNDAIFRFKLLQRIAPQPEYNYYLGRLYLEKGNDNKALLHLNSYAQNGATQLREETEFCLALAKNQLDNITSIPVSIIKHTNTQLSYIYQKEFQETQPELLTSKVFTAFKPVVGNRFNEEYIRILDVGCADGILGHLCRNNLAVEKLIGFEFVPQLADIARRRKYNNGRTYSQIIYKNFWHAHHELEDKYHLIIADDWISYYTSLNEFFDIVINLLAAKGLCVLTFTDNNLPNQYKLSKQMELFEFNTNYIEKILSEKKLKIVLKKEIKYDTGINSMMIIIER